MKIGAGVVIALALSCASNPAMSQDAEFLRQVGIDARDVILGNLDRLTCSGVPCSPASELELATPPVTDDEAASIAAVAVVSAIAEHCALDWAEGSFVPMMEGWRAVPGTSDRKLALIGATHGLVQGQAKQAFDAQGACDEQTRTAIQSRLDQNRD